MAEPVVIFMDHDPWNNPSDTEQDLYSDTDGLELEDSLANITQDESWHPAMMRMRTDTYERKLSLLSQTTHTHTLSLTYSLPLPIYLSVAVRYEIWDL